MMRARRAIAAIGLTLVACGGDAVPVPEEPSAPTAVTSQRDDTGVTAAPVVTPAISTPASVPPAVLGLSSGRGDDASLEMAIWLGSDPTLATDHRLMIGIDADDSYPGVGDPFAHLEGYLVITPQGSALYEEDRPIATGIDLVELASWGLADDVLRVFFIGTFPPKAGTAWVLIEVDGNRVPFGVAGAAFGTACSYHTAGLPVPSVAGVPDPGVPCRYPTG